MAYKISFSPQADQDLDTIFLYYLQEASLQIAEKVVQNLITRLQILSQQPNIGVPQAALNCRKFNIDKWGCYYEIIDQQIYILRIFDTRQSPDKLQL